MIMEMLIIMKEIIMVKLIGILRILIKLMKETKIIILIIIL